MAGLLIPPQLTFTDQTGAPLAGGQLFTYIVGTLVNNPTFQDSAETILNTNPIILDDRGACVVYGDGDYRLILEDNAGNQIFDLLTSEPLPASAISAAMLPIVGALTLQQARDLMGITAAINAAISTIDLLPGPTGPVGPVGPLGPIGPTGPSAAASTTFSLGNPGFILLGTYGSSPLIQFGSAASGSGGGGSVSYAMPFATGVITLQTVASDASWWANPTSISNTGFQFVTSSPFVGGNWQGGPTGIYWFAVGA